MKSVWVVYRDDPYETRQATLGGACATKEEAESLAEVLDTKEGLFFPRYEVEEVPFGSQACTERG